MIDFAGISVFFLPEYVHRTNHGAVLKDIEALCSALDIPLTGEIYYENGKRKVRSLRHSFESLPSSYASLAYKIINGSDFVKEPYVRIAGNPAKLLQGHNVFGSDNADLCVMSVVEAFQFAFPELASCLDWYHATIDYIDVTYTAKVENEHIAQQVIDTLKNLSYGQTKVKVYEQYKTTVYWNKGSEHRELKAYLKTPELQKQIHELTRKWVNEKHDHLKHQLTQLTKPEIQAWAQGAVRFEARLKSRWLVANGIECTLAYFTDPTKQPDCPALWAKAFKEVFKTFEGASMNAHDHTSVLEKLRDVHKRELHKDGVPTGRFSYAKAERLYDFYMALIRDGYKATKARITERSRATFKRNQDDLMAAGLSLAQLMQFTGEQSNVVPLLRLINVDFGQQLPVDFVEPKPLSQQALPMPALRLAS